MSRITRQAQYDAGDMSFFREIVQGYSSVWPVTFTDKDDLPIDVNDHTFEAGVEFYQVTISPSGVVPGSFKPLADAPKPPPLSIDNDYGNANQIGIVIPTNLYEDESEIDATDIPCAVIYLKWTFGTNVRVIRFGLPIRRGKTS